LKFYSTLRKFTRSFTLVGVFLLLGVISITPAQAHVIDRVEINHVEDEAEIQIIFDVRIQYLREASLNSGEVHIFINLLEVDPDRTSLVPEAMDSPPSDIAPHFTVAYPGLDSSLTIRFDKAVSYRVRPGNDGHSISIFTPMTKPTSLSQVEMSTPAHTQEEVEQEAKKLIGSARDALKQDDAVAAVETLNQLLNLPPNQQSQVAQELIGEAREKNGEYAKARVEYELYLKLYPDAAEVKLVKDRLAKLPAELYAKSVPQTVRKKSVDEKMIVYGSLSQSYYKGMFHTDTATANGSNITTDSFTGTDQSMLISSLDMTGRKRTENIDTRIVLRDDYRANFLARAKDDNRLSAFYIEQSARDSSYMYRIGRQTGATGGVQGRFDGAWLGYSPSSAWRVNGVLGTPVDFYNNGAERKNFAGVNVEFTRPPEQWSGSGYFIEQHVGSVVDRKSVGMETHYFDAKRNYMGLLDYDMLFKAINIAMIQGNWTTEAGSNYLLLADHRKSPILQITNALPGQTMPTIAALVQSGVSTKSLRDDAKSLTPTSNLLMVGMTYPYSSHWRLGGDFRINNTSGTGAVGALPASSGSGNTYITTAQAIGNDLLYKNDMGLVSASVINAQSYKGHSLAFTQVETPWQRWRLDASLQLYNQNDNLNVHMTRITPSLKLSYRMSESMSFDGEGGIEKTHNSSALRDEKTTRKYIYVGYRWDFQ
jgi:hypothetical protein